MPFCLLDLSSCAAYRQRHRPQLLRIHQQPTTPQQFQLTAKLAIGSRGANAVRPAAVEPRPLKGRLSKSQSIEERRVRLWRKQWSAILKNVQQKLQKLPKQRKQQQALRAKKPEQNLGWVTRPHQVQQHQKQQIQQQPLTSW